VGGQALIATPDRACAISRRPSRFVSEGPHQRAFRASISAAFFFTAVLAAGCAGGQGGEPEDGLAPGAVSDFWFAPRVALQHSGVGVLLQAVSPVNEDVVWVSGHGGTWLRTLDGGASWSGGVVPDADTLQFRDVHAISADVAWLLAAGPGEMSRIYSTVDGGMNWRIQWVNDEPDGFYDCLSFFDDRRGLVYGDAVNGELRILRTTDGGEHWSLVSAGRLPAAQVGEGGFAASGTCLAVGAQNVAWIGTGNSDPARVLRSNDRGWTWVAAETPLIAGEAAGITSISFRDERFGLVVGGDLALPDEHTANVALTADGGVSWTAGGTLRMAGAAYGGAWVPGATPPVAVAVGPGGADWSSDGGVTWSGFDDRNWWGLGFVSPDVGWIVGPEGRIGKVSFR
jgi:photosystem II stability/assembly factor-like uncharacterized protein